MTIGCVTVCGVTPLPFFWVSTRFSGDRASCRACFASTCIPLPLEKIGLMRRLVDQADIYRLPRLLCFISRVRHRRREEACVGPIHERT